MQRRLRVIALPGVIEKSPILLSQYWTKKIIGWHHNYFVFLWYQQYFRRLYISIYIKSLCPFLHATPIYLVTKMKKWFSVVFLYMQPGKKVVHILWKLSSPLTFFWARLSINQFYVSLYLSWWLFKVSFVSLNFFCHIW